MKQVDIEDIKKLRGMTGVGMTDAKKALVEAGGDFDKALKAMRKKNLAKAGQRAERVARAGLVESYSHDGRIGVVVEVNCETDFVAKTDEFKELVKDLCLHIAASEPKNVASLLQQEYVKDPEMTVDAYLKQHIAKLGENIVVARFSRFELGRSD